MDDTAAFRPRGAGLRAAPSSCSHVRRPVLAPSASSARSTATRPACASWAAWRAPACARARTSCSSTGWISPGRLRDQRRRDPRERRRVAGLLADRPAARRHASKGNVDPTLDGQPALSARRAMLRAVPEDQRTGSTRGCSSDAPRAGTQKGPGDWLIHLLGADRERGAIAVADHTGCAGDPPARAATQGRDGRPRNAARAAGSDTAASAALLFARATAAARTCSARRTTTSSACSQALRRPAAQAMPASGMFCASESDRWASRNLHARAHREHRDPASARLIAGHRRAVGERRTPRTREPQRELATPWYAAARPDRPAARATSPECSA